MFKYFYSLFGIHILTLHTFPPKKKSHRKLKRDRVAIENCILNFISVG